MIEVQARSLSSQIYGHLRQMLMSARLKPGDRLKIRDLARQMGTSETPVREALFQLVKDGALEMKSGHYFRVRRMSAAEYLELRDIRLVLEPLAALHALPHVDDAFLANLISIHDKLIEAESSKDYPVALQSNYDFHFAVYRRSQMPHLIDILERMWIQVGPLLTFLYPYGHPIYDARHQHLDVIDAFKAKDSDALRHAIEQDLIQGGRNFVRHLLEVEAQQAKAQEQQE